MLSQCGPDDSAGSTRLQSIMRFLGRNPQRSQTLLSLWWCWHRIGITSKELLQYYIINSSGLNFHVAQIKNNFYKKPNYQQVKKLLRTGSCMIYSLENAFECRKLIYSTLRMNKKLLSLSENTAILLTFAFSSERCLNK